MWGIMAPTSPEPKFFKTLFEDLGNFFSDLFSGAFFKQIRTDLYQIREYFLDKNREKRLQQMGRFKRCFYLTGWLFKSLFFRLSSFRRILLIIALAFILTARDQEDINEGKIFIGAIMFLFIILLELKDLYPWLPIIISGHLAP